MIDLVAAIDSIKKSLKSELPSRFFGGLKFRPENGANLGCGRGGQIKLDKGFLAWVGRGKKGEGEDHSNTPDPKGSVDSEICTSKTHQTYMFPI